MSKWILISLILFLLFPLRFFGQEPAQFNCIEVLLDGSVTIHWTPPSNTAGFQRYEIFFSANGNTFNNIADISNQTISQYTDPNANANSASRFYYVNTVYDIGEASSNTLQSIYLIVLSEAQSTQARLIWNVISDPLPDGSSNSYTIFEEYPAGEWVEKGTSISIEETYEITVCNDSINFRVEMNNSNGCSSVSNVNGARFTDEILPDKPVFDSVSTNNAGQSILGWQIDESADIGGYIIYQNQNGFWIEIQRINGFNSAFYIDASVDPCTDVFSYAIATFDICGNISPGTFSEPLNTMLLDNIEFDVCSNSSTITWTPYINAQPALDGYKIFRSTDGLSFSEVGLVAADELSFVDMDLIGGETYDYYVQAIFGNRSSSSCTKSINTFSYLKPQFVYLANASVLPTNEVEITINVDTLVNSCTWEVWSSNENDPTPVLDTVFIKDEQTESLIKYTDKSANAGLAYYSYFVVARDSCDNPVLESDILTTIKLSGFELSKTQIQLDWTPLTGWDEGVEKYYIFRIEGDSIPELPIDSVGPDILTYIDDFTNVDNPSGFFGWWVQAKQNEGNPLGYQELSNSNRVGQAQDTEMYMPNAFRPGGNTPEFKPIFQYFSGSQYLFQVYNRWGQLIFETTDAFEGWNGQYKNKEVPLGVYAYKVTYRNLEDQSIVLAGTVTVIY